MKKLLSILLVLVLLLSFVPASLASEDPDIDRVLAEENLEEDAEETIEEIVNETTEAVSEESLDENAETAAEDLLMSIWTPTVDAELDRVTEIRLRTTSVLEEMLLKSAPQSNL